MAVQPLQASDLIFPIPSQPIEKTLSQISRSRLSISARLHSIAHDAAFVRTVASALEPLPIIANERCGSWYVPPELKAGSAYFKSTDGHFGEWAFSLRRLNLGVLGLVGEGGGAVIVDTTRRGKQARAIAKNILRKDEDLPDALSKTAPIWIAVFNRLLFPERTDAHALFVHSRIVSESEIGQIEARLSGFVESAKKLDLDLRSLRENLKKPMRPLWIARSLPRSRLEEMMGGAVGEAFHPIYLCMASVYQDATQSDIFSGYVQGAGDDAESWAHGLTPTMYWEFKDELLECSEDRLPSLIRSATSSDIDRSITRSSEDGLEAIVGFPQISVGAFDLSKSQINGVISSLESSDCRVILCVKTLNQEMVETLGDRLLHLRCGAGKLGSRDLRPELEKVPRFMKSVMSDDRIILCCTSGRDLSIGILLAIVCLWANENGDICGSSKNESLTKFSIKTKLAKVACALPSASPSRATLNAVNAFLLKRPD